MSELPDLCHRSATTCAPNWGTGDCSRGWQPPSCSAGAADWHACATPPPPSPSARRARRCVLESPHEVTVFQYNPANPDIILGGCYNGQLVLWDTSGTAATGSAGAGAAGARGSAGRGSTGAGTAAGMASWDESGEQREAANTPVIRHRHLSAVEHSHTSSITDVCWLPGICLEADRSGRVAPALVVDGDTAGAATQQVRRVPGMAPRAPWAMACMACTHAPAPMPCPRPRDAHTRQRLHCSRPRRNRSPCYAAQRWVPQPWAPLLPRPTCREMPRSVPAWRPMARCVGAASACLCGAHTDPSE